MPQAQSLGKICVVGTDNRMLADADIVVRVPARRSVTWTRQRSKRAATASRVRWATARRNGTCTWSLTGRFWS